MGFYIRKGFRLGPLRLNLSQGGVGASVGVRGARVGVTPRGRAYVHCGLGGIYYRSYLDGEPNRPVRRRVPPPAATLGVDATLGPERLIESGDVGEMADRSASALIAELNRRRRRISLRLWALVICALATAALLLRGLGGAAAGVMATGVAALIPLGIVERRRRTMHIVYDLDADYAECYERLVEAFRAAAASQRVWLVESAAQVLDRKYHAGAGEVVRRTRVSPRLALPRCLRSNIKPPMLPAGRQTLYLLPDTILVYEGRRVGAVSYAELCIQSERTRFVESDRPPRDARQVDTTWRYVNKKGGPDRRFRHNPSLPVMLYGTLRWTSVSGLNEEFQFSRAETVERLRDAIAELGEVVAEGARPQRPRRRMSL